MRANWYEIILNFPFLEDFPCEIEIMNSTGSMMDLIRLTGKNYPPRISISKYSQGIYFLRITAEGQGIKNCKLIILK